MCLNPIRVPIKKYGRTIGYNQFGCGKCHECLGRKVNSYVQKYYREAHFRKSMHFVTLTYDNEHLPVSVCPVYYHEPSESFVPLSKPFFDKEVGLSAYLHCARVDSVPNDHRWTVRCGDVDSVIAPSLKRDDVRLWLKEFRNNNPDLRFSFSFIGEYGKHGRPHYHGCCFGLSNDNVRRLVDTWNRGFTLVKPIPLLAHNSKDDVVSVARYVAKYMHKGSFDDDKVLHGYVEYPRVFSSTHLGDGDNINNLRDWYLGKDQFPNVSIHDKTFSESYLNLVESRLQSFLLGNKRQTLSPWFTKKFLKYEYINPLTKKKYPKSSNLALVLNKRLQDRLTADSERQYNELQEMYGKVNETEFRSALKSFIDSEEILHETKSGSYDRDRKKSFSKSKL